MERFMEMLQAGAGKQETTDCGARETLWEAAYQGTTEIHWKGLPLDVPYTTVCWIM